MLQIKKNPGVVMEEKNNWLQVPLVEKKETVGAVAVRLMEKGYEKTDVIEQQRAMQEEWMANIYLAVENGRKLFTNDFYIHIETKRERILDNVLRNYFIPRESCPSPNYDQTVYKYDRAKEELEFLWVIPSKDAALMMKEQCLLIDKSEHELLRFVMDFFDGTLERRAMELNGESLIFI
jgi:hypothetical protein